MAEYFIGIDLGTTNCVMSNALIDGKSDLNPVAISQITEPGVQSKCFQLPSFIYWPLPEELAQKTTQLAWQTEGAPVCLGAYARQRASEVPHRVVSSVKSWLCHTGIDRREACLPEGAESHEQMSPVQGVTELLRHLKNSWDQQFLETPFSEQHISITVPASFDPSARQLVEEAAIDAGYPEIALLEEPQAAFYAWLYGQQEQWRELLNVGDTVLVVDIGGGTTDFSLIEVQQKDGSLSLERKAVGAHLLLGGDNLDLALAYTSKAKLEAEGQRVDDWQMQSLVHRCRQAKEAFLGDSPPESFELTIAGRGRSLVGGSVSLTLQRDEVEALLVEGFFPKVRPEERSSQERRLGMQQVGLPYAQDARITCQLAKFLSMTGETDSDSMEQFVLPTAILFNGGTMRSIALRQRVVEVLNEWAKILNQPAVQVLDGADYHNAVSRGATYAGFVRQGGGVRIRAGVSRSYYIGVEEAIPAVPGMPPPLKAVCVVPYGMEEGSKASLDDQEFSLVLGEHTAFRFFSRTTPKLEDDSDPVMGTVVSRWQHELSELHPIETVLERGEQDGATVRVSLHSEVSDVGTLELWCQARDGRRWKLEFDLRH